MTVRYRLRWTELLLLVFAGMIVLGGNALLSAVHHQRILQADLRYPVYYVASTILLSLWMGSFSPRADQMVLPVVTLVAGIGMLVIGRLNADLGHKQLFWIILGEVLAAVVLAIPRSVNLLRLYKYSWAVLGLFLILLTIVGGTDINGSGYRRWIGFHGIYLQPVELLKILMAVFFAAYLDEKHELLAAARLKLGFIRLPPFQYLGPLVLVWGLSLILLVKQNDLGSALLFLGIFLAMIYVGTARAVYPVSGLVMFGAGAFAAFHLFAHVRDRTEIWLDPFAHAQGSGFQLVQGLIALATGGIGGQGLGQGMPYKVPVVTTDFILSAVGEELGLAGVACLLLLLLFLVFRGLSVAMSSEDGFQKLLAAGLMATLAIQTIVIVGGTTRLMPLTGVPLPFLSYGGSSAVANYLMIALLLKISQESSDTQRRPA
jgi:cell division protein FtsW (lipid II flippase)